MAFMNSNLGDWITDLTGYVETAKGYGETISGYSNAANSVSNSLSWLWGGKSATPPSSGGTQPPYQAPFSIGQFFKDYGLYIGLGIGGIIVLKSVLK